MDLFVLDQEFARQEAQVALLAGDERLPALTELAWHCRQRDTGRALILAEEARQLLAQSVLPSAEQQSIAARLDLIHGEAELLFARPDAAERFARKAHDVFDNFQDGVGRFDSLWLLAAIALERGQPQQFAEELESAITLAERCGDQERRGLAIAAIARSESFLDFRAADARWTVYLELDEAQLSPAIAVWVSEYRAFRHGSQADFGHAILHYTKAFEGALKTGQIRRAIISAGNIGHSFNCLSDYHTALEWVQRGLDLARPLGWPGSVSLCLSYMADTQRWLGQFSAAEDLMHESLTLLVGIPNSIAYGIGLIFLGALQQSQHKYQQALETFGLLENRSGLMKHFVFKMDALHGQAQALADLGRPREALEKALQALEISRRHGETDHHVSILKGLADIHAQYSLPAPADMQERNATLHYLHQALQKANSIDGYTVPDSLLEALAVAHAASGDYRQAYGYGMRALNAHRTTHSEDATNRSVAMQVLHQTARAKEESEHLRAIAAAEARRAELSQQNSATLQHLSAIGQEIMAQLDPAEVYEVLNRHVHSLLDATYFSIFLLNPDQVSMTRSFGNELERVMPPTQVPLDSPVSMAARCLRERCEIAVNRERVLENDPGLIPGTMPMLSLLFGPLAIGDRVIGVMTVQSPQVDAYDERERLVFRTLCAYGAIAMDNAAAYAQLKDMQKQLVEKEKMAALGSLVAGVAHELNTPIGNSLLIASTIQENTRSIAAKIDAGRVKRSELETYIAETREGTDLMLHGLDAAASLVAGFKQVAVDQANEQRRPFNLLTICEQVTASWRSRFKRAGHRLELDIPAQIEMNSYPGPFSQVLGNLVDNALLHAFQDQREGVLRIGAELSEGGQVRIRVADNGVGIARQNIKHIFEPFFTTSLGSGGSGLGLSISYNIVTSVLHGSIEVGSVPGRGTCFTLAIPLTAPERISIQSVAG